jgi:ABC-type uncharacterized transport system substrate-binding protein
VSSFSRSDKNLTGIYFLLAELVAKRLLLLREVLPAAKRIAVLVNPNRCGRSPSDGAECGCRRAAARS